MGEFTQDNLRIVLVAPVEEWKEIAKALKWLGDDSTIEWKSRNTVLEFSRTIANATGLNLTSKTEENKDARTN